VNLAYGGWVATALYSDLRDAGGIQMKVLFLSFIVGLGVGVLYGLIRVKSPAPPIVALLGLLGIVLGEQFGIWIQMKKLDVSRAASVCLVGERYDRPHPSSTKVDTVRVQLSDCAWITPGLVRETHLFTNIASTPE
jgi:XapX domain-containing protein